MAALVDVFLRGFFATSIVAAMVALGLVIAGENQSLAMAYTIMAMLTLAGGIISGEVIRIRHKRYIDERDKGITDIVASVHEHKALVEAVIAENEQLKEEVEDAQEWARKASIHVMKLAGEAAILRRDLRVAKQRQENYAEANRLAQERISELEARLGIVPAGERHLDAYRAE